jgi:hypothetical protein
MDDPNDLLRDAALEYDGDELRDTVTLVKVRAENRERGPLRWIGLTLGVALGLLMGFALAGFRFGSPPPERWPTLETRTDGVPAPTPPPER